MTDANLAAAIEALKPGTGARLPRSVLTAAGLGHLSRKAITESGLKTLGECRALEPHQAGKPAPVKEEDVPFRLSHYSGRKAAEILNCEPREVGDVRRELRNRLGRNFTVAEARAARQ